MENRFIAYEKIFPTNENFIFSQFIKNLDKEDFSPFVLHINEVDTAHCYLKFEHLQYPIGLSGRKGNIADAILLSECQIEWLKRDNQILLRASINATGTTVIFIFMALFLFITILTKSLLAFLIVIAILGSQFFIYNIDKKRYERIGKIAMNSDWKM